MSNYVANTDDVNAYGGLSSDEYHAQKQTSLLFDQTNLADFNKLFSQSQAPQVLEAYNPMLLPMTTDGTEYNYNQTSLGMVTSDSGDLIHPLSQQSALMFGMAPMMHAYSVDSGNNNSSGNNSSNNSGGALIPQSIFSTHTSVSLPPQPSATIPMGISSSHVQYPYDQDCRSQYTISMKPGVSCPPRAGFTPTTQKTTSRRITLNARQQLVTLQYFYDMYPQDSYSDEDLFRLSQACGLEFELVKRRLANLNGKQRDFRNALFNTDLGFNQDMILQILSQMQNLGDGSAESSSTYDDSNGSNKRRKKNNQVTLSLESSLFRSTNYAHVIDDLNSRKRVGKDERVLIELHHREILGMGYVLYHCYVLGQSKTVKEWLNTKRMEVQAWLTQHYNGSLTSMPVLVDPQRPYYLPTTPAELLESEVGPQYLQYTASLKSKRGSSAAMAIAMSNAQKGYGNISDTMLLQGGMPNINSPSSNEAGNTGGGWLSGLSKANSGSNSNKRHHNYYVETNVVEE